MAQTNGRQPDAEIEVEQSYLRLLEPLRTSSLRVKLLVPVSVFLVLSALVTLLVYEVGTRQTANQLLRQEVGTELNQLTEALALRAEAVEQAAGLLAADPALVEAIRIDDDETIFTVDSRAVVVRDRFSLDVIQVYNSAGIARANLLQSDLYQVSFLLDAVGEDFAGVIETEGRLLYVTTTTITGGLGTVLTGIDLTNEVQRLAFQQQLSGDASLGTDPVAQLTFDGGSTGGEFTGRAPVSLGGSTLSVTVTQRISQITGVLTAGRVGIIFSSLGATLIFIILTDVALRLLTRPVSVLSDAVEELGRSRFDNPDLPVRDYTSILDTGNVLGIGVRDELYQLAEAFTNMARELSQVYTNLVTNLRRTNRELQSAYDNTLLGWAGALELRNADTRRDTERVTNLTVKVARLMGVSEDDIVHIRRGAYLHDVGKLALPDHILHRNRSLSEEEWAVLRQHPLYAYTILKPIGYLDKAIEIPYCSHEHWDGSGYPRGLAGRDIPLSARVFAVVDTYDGFGKGRMPRPARSRDELLRYIRAQAGKQFDPSVVAVFLDMISKEADRSAEQFET